MGPEYSFEIKLDKPLVGFAVESVKTGESPGKVNVAIKQFLTVYNGDFFYNCLDSISQLFLSEWKMREHKNESCINNCLILVGRENIAHVHINCPIFFNIIGKRDITKGEFIFKDDFADITSVDFPGVDINNDWDIFFVFSNGWRRALYFDVTSRQPNISCEKGDFKTIAASLYAYMIFPEVFRLDEATAKKLFDKGWFPFIQLLGWRYGELYNHAINDFPFDDIERKIIDSFEENLIKKMYSRWITKATFKEHSAIIEAGINYYLKGEYIAAISILYPRIEGLMRHLCLGEVKKPHVADLIKKLKETGVEKSGGAGLFLPLGFGEYLKAFYFKNFDEDTGELDLSRHTIAHGVAKADDFNRIKAFQAILILDQISYFVS